MELKDRVLKALKSISEEMEVVGEGAPSMGQVIEFLIDNPSPDDAKTHAWAEKHGWNIHETEAVFYDMATKFANLLVEGRGADFTGRIDPKQLRMGIEVEMEHTNDREFAEKIATDHLAEFPDYYTALDEMETMLKKKHGKSVEEKLDSIFDQATKMKKMIKKRMQVRTRQFTRRRRRPGGVGVAAAMRKGV